MSNKKTNKNNRTVSAKVLKPAEIKSQPEKIDAKVKPAKTVASKQEAISSSGTVSLNCRHKYPYVERMTQIFAFLMLAGYTLTIGDQFYANITEVKFMWFKWFTLIACGAIFVIFVVGLLDRKIGPARQKEGNVGFDIAMIASVVYLVWATIATLASEYELSELFVGVGRYEGLLSLILYTIIFLVVSIWGEYTDIYVYGIGAMSILFGLFAMIQFTGKPLFYPEGYSFWDVNFISTIGNVDCVSGIAALFIPALICGFVFLEGKSRYFLLVGEFMMSYTFLVAGADSGKMGLIAAFIVAASFLFDTREHAKDSCLALSVFTLAVLIYKMWTPAKDGAVFAFGTTAKMALVATIVLVGIWAFLWRTGWWFKFDAKIMRRIIAIVLLVCIVIGLVFVFVYNGDVQLLVDAKGMLHGHLDDYAGSERGYVWKMSVELIKEQPILGGGRGSFGNRFYPYNQWYWDHDYNVVFDFAHNDYLQIGVETGLVGLLIYIGFLGILAYRGLKVAAKYPRVLIFGTGIVGCLGHLFFSFSIAIVTPIMWTMMGCMNKLINQVPKDKQEKQEA